MKTKKDVMKFLANVPNINSGGCLIAAYALYLFLKKQGVKSNFQIVTLDNRWEKIEPNWEFINGNSENAESAWHFGWTFNGGRTIYDCDGRIADHSYLLKLVIPKELTEKFCQSALKSGNWNHWFVRKVEVPKIEEKLGINLNI